MTGARLLGGQGTSCVVGPLPGVRGTITGVICGRVPMRIRRVRHIRRASGSALWKLCGRLLLMRVGVGVLIPHWIRHVGAAWHRPGK